MNLEQQGDRFFRRFVDEAPWPSRRFDAIFVRRKAAESPDEQPLSVFLQKGVVPRSEGDGNNNRLGEDLSKYLVVRQGDLVFNKLRTWQGGFGRSNFDGIVSPAYFVCKPLIDVDGRFIDYLLHSNIYLAELTRISKWMPPSQFDISWEDLRLLPVLLPAKRVQKEIADYLECETAKTDALVGKYERLIELLEEKRIVRITQAVTKGLNPATPMKSSGVDWIGEIPAHWQVTPCAYISSLITKGTTPTTIGKEFVDEGIRFVKVEAIGERLTIEQEKCSAIDAETHAIMQRSQLEAGDVLVAIAGAIGRVAVVSDRDVPANINQAVALVRPVASKVSSDWLALWLSSHGIKASLAGSSVQSAQANLSLTDLGHIRVAVPTQPEQSHIIRKLSSELDQLELLKQKMLKAIELTREHRSSLITAAVTGKINVRTYKTKDLEVSA